MAIPADLTGDDRAAFDTCMAAFRRLEDRVNLSQTVTGDAAAREELKTLLSQWHDSGERPEEIDSEYLSTVSALGHESKFK